MIAGFCFLVSRLRVFTQRFLVICNEIKMNNHEPYLGGEGEGGLCII